ncbi:MAG: amino acid ABC transporter substrate-binding protein [Proteobacteria bacterium]|nr:amino acid ABC transporter substrate-binding protein [Pseudomonadota bacterium]
MVNIKRIVQFAMGVVILFLDYGFAADNKPIKIGATVSLSGRYKEPSEMIHLAFQLWQKEINQNGGLLARPVKLIFYDDKSDPEIARKMYRRLIEKDKVELVFSPYGTPLTLAASEISEKHKRVMLAAAASGEIIWERNYKHVFGVYALANRYFIGQLDLMARKGYRSVALLYDKHSPFNVDVIEGAEKWAKRFRIEVIFKEGFENPEKELPGLIKELKEINPKGLVVSCYPPECYLALKLMAKSNFKPNALGLTIAPIHPEFYKKAGSMAEGVFGPSQWEPDERIPFPGTNKFIENFKAFAGKMPSYHAGSTFAACQLYEEAINKIGSIDNEKIKNYISFLDTVTVIGRFKVDSKGKQVGHNPILIQWQNGKKKIVWPQVMQTSKPVF